MAPGSQCRHKPPCWDLKRLIRFLSPQGLTQHDERKQMERDPGGMVTKHPVSCPAQGSSSPALRSGFSCVSITAEPSSDLCSSENTSLTSWFYTEPVPTCSMKCHCLRKLRLAASFQAARAPPEPHTPQPVRSARAQETPAALPQTESEEGKRRTEGREDTSVVWRAPRAAACSCPAISKTPSLQGWHLLGFSQSKGRFFTEIRPRESRWLPKLRSCCLIL